MVNESGFITTLKSKPVGARHSAWAVSPEAVALRSVSRRADAARGRGRAGKQHIPHVLPGSPDWCAPLKGLVLEVSS